MKKQTGPGRPKLPESAKKVHFSTTLPAKVKAWIFRFRGPGESTGDVIVKAVEALKGLK